MSKLISVVVLVVLIKCSSARCTVNNVCETIDDLNYSNRLGGDWSFVHFKPPWHPVTLKNLQPNAFKNFPHLQYITFSKVLNKIHKDSLSGLNKLYAVVFVDNILKELPYGLFQGCPLEKIVVKNCQLQNINQSFNYINTLTDLKLENNNFTQINSNIFPVNLIEIILISNNIQVIEENTFHNLKKLQVLNLSGNNIKQFNFNRMLQNNRRLKDLKLSDNQLETITPLEKLNKLKYFYINNNLISKIERNTFSNLTDLQIINLSDNQLDSLSRKHFGNHTFLDVRKFYLNGNRIEVIDVSFLKIFPNLNRVWIENVQFNCECVKQLKKYFHKQNIVYFYSSSNKTNENCN